MNIERKQNTQKKTNKQFKQTTQTYNKADTATHRNTNKQTKQKRKTTNETHNQKGKKKQHRIINTNKKRNKNIIRQAAIHCAVPAENETGR